MNFSETLNPYISQIGCTAKELAAAQMALDLANTTVEFDVEI